MIDLRDIQSLSDFQRDARAHIRHMEKTGQPSVLTVNGQAKVIIQDIASYQKLVRQAQESADLRRLQRGVADFRARRAYDAEPVLDELEVRHFGKAAGKASDKPAAKKSLCRKT